MPARLIYIRHNKMESLNINENEKSDVSTRVYLPKALFQLKTRRTGLTINDLHNFPQNDRSHSADSFFEKISMHPLKDNKDVSNQTSN